MGKTKKTLLVVVGPTAVGKTKVAVELAKTFSCEIISTDSRQFYKEMDIGTAKPTTEEMQGIPHHFINNLSIHDSYSAGQFELEALTKLEELFSKSDFAIAVGGSGLFVNALCFGLDDLPPVSPELRARLNQEWEEKGIEYIQRKVQDIDPAYFSGVDINNKHRMLRALEVWETSGKKISDLQKNNTAKRPFHLVFIGLNTERSNLYERINRRVDLMVKNGLLEEVEKLRPHQNLGPMKTVGYQEFYENESSSQKAIELIKRNSRRYAKRQITWFKKTPQIEWFEAGNSDKIIAWVNEKTTN